MADLVQSKIAPQLVRKIGYSVGKQFLVSRVKDLVEVCVRDSTVTRGVFENELVVNRWELKKTTAAHLYNLYGSLGILSSENGKPIMRSVLTAGVILWRIFEGDSSRQNKAIESVLLAAITSADGELFGNLLISEFGLLKDKKAIERQLAKFREAKIAPLRSQLSSEKNEGQLFRLIGFESFSETEDSKGNKVVRSNTSVNKNSMTVREMKALAKQGGNSSNLTYGVKLSESFIGKYASPREKWALDLGLFAEGSKTQMGERWIREILALHGHLDGHNDPPVVIMPTDLELYVNQSHTYLRKDLVVPYADLIRSIHLTYVSQSQGSLWTNLDLYETLKQIGGLYVRADTRFSILRREIPISILALVFLGLSVGREEALGNVVDDLRSLADEREDVFIRKSRKSFLSVSMSGGFTK